MATVILWCLIPYLGPTTTTLSKATTSKSRLKSADILCGILGNQATRSKKPTC